MGNVNQPPLFWKFTTVVPFGNGVTANRSRPSGGVAGGDGRRCSETWTGFSGGGARERGKRRTVDKSEIGVVRGRPGGETATVSDHAPTTALLDRFVADITPLLPLLSVWAHGSLAGGD